MNQIKITKAYGAGLYYATGHVTGALSQYTIAAQGRRWNVTRVFGHGPHFYTDFATKRQAVEAIRAA